MASTVDIHLPMESDATKWIHALSIPHEDIKRLTVRPLKWLRFATFAVCGAKGHLSATQGGETVDYENVSFDNLANRYFYTPDNAYHLVDYKVFNDKCTTTAATRRSSSFRDEIRARDDRCVITASDIFDAAHIIPRSKGDNYISYIVHDRSSLYERLPSSLEEDVDIDCTENGILLRKDLHEKFGKAQIAFLMTPNFAMVSTDVPPVEEGPIPDNRTTLQYMMPTTERFSVPPCGADVGADWSRDEVHPPPSILLDFMYGAAITKYWKCDRLHEMLEKRFKVDFATVLAKSLKRSAPEDDEPEGEPDNDKNKDPDWAPSTSKQKMRKTVSSDASPGLLEAMDDMLFLSMLLKGKTPQSMAAEWERQRKEEESCSQEHGREKVQQWLNMGATSVNNVEKGC